MTPSDLSDLVNLKATAYGLPEDLLASQVRVESSGNPWAFRYEPYYFERYLENNPGAKGAKYGPIAACSLGLMQLLVETAIEIGFQGRPEDLFDPATGLEWGARYMWQLVGWASGDYQKALSAYNGGKGTALKGAPYANQPYVNAVYSVRA